MTEPNNNNLGPTRPRWTMTYRLDGANWTKEYDVPHFNEAFTRLMRDVPACTFVDAQRSEVPL